MPNYISRNNIDVTPFGDSYGAMDTVKEIVLLQIYIL
jgi:hypothetical protein